MILLSVNLYRMEILLNTVFYNIILCSVISHQVRRDLLLISIVGFEIKIIIYRINIFNSVYLIRE